ncbi:unnamed protein product [Closterium sp. NIES-53]
MFFVPLLTSSQPPLDSVLCKVLNSPLPAPSPYAEQKDSLTERREPQSRPASPVRAVRTSRRVPRPRPPPVPGTHIMALRPSSIPLRVPLPSPPASSLPDVPDPESELVRAAKGECALGTDVLEDIQEDFQCLAATVPHLVAMLLAPEGDPDASDIPTTRSYAEAITGPYSSQWQTAMDAEIASWKSTGTYVDAVPPSGANIVDGMWIFRVKRPPGSPPVFKARYIARGFSQRQGVDFFQTFSPTPKMTTLRVLLHVTDQRDYEMHSLYFSTAFLQGSLHEEIWLRRPPGFTGSFPVGTQWSLRRPVYGLRQVPPEWHDRLRTTLAALGFAPSTADPSLFLRTDPSLPPIYVLVYVNDFVFATADTEALALVKTELQKRHTCTDLGPSTLWLLILLATVHSSAYRSLALNSTFGRVQRPHSPPVLYVDNKAMIALCQEHRLEHRTKHIALRYFLARELQQRGQLRLVYVATQANTADIFTKALQSGDHQRFSTVLGLLALLFLTGLVTTCSSSLCLWGVSTCTNFLFNAFILVKYSDTCVMFCCPCFCLVGNLEHGSFYFSWFCFVVWLLYFCFCFCLSFCKCRREVKRKEVAVGYDIEWSPGAFDKAANGSGREIGPSESRVGVVGTLPSSISDKGFSQR